MSKIKLVKRIKYAGAVHAALMELGWDAETAAAFLDDIPDADAVEVIHCKDCFYWMKAKVNKKGFLICPASGMEITATDFCSYAEKRKCHYDR